MIVCSCNVFSDHEVRSAVAKITRLPRVSEIYAAFGGRPRCGRCARTIKAIVEDIPTGALSSVAASANLRSNLRLSAETYAASASGGQ
jgi:bacterioferritin-associated ferredoxin